MRIVAVLNKLAIVIIILFLIILFIQMYNRAGNNDFTSYLLSSKAILYGTNPYDTESPFAYIYPPTFAFLLIPFSVLPPIALQILWFWINVFLLVYLIKNLGINLSSVYQQHTGLFYFCFISILFNIIQNNLVNAQVNILILFLCFLFWQLYKNSYKTWATLILALAISIKIVPAFLLLYLFFRRDFKQIIISIGFTVFFLLLPFIVTGLKIIEIYNNYFQILYNKSNLVNQNTDQGEMFFGVIGAFKYFLPINDYLINSIVPIISLIIFYFIFEIFLKRKAIPDNTISVFGIYLVGLILISPISEPHHLVYLLPLFFLIYIDLWYNFKEKGVIDYILYLIIIVALFFAKNISQPMYFYMIISLIVLSLKNIVFKKTYLVENKI